MSERSQTRQDLEAALRRLLPTKGASDSSDRSAITALAGVGGVVSGFLWGWMRSRRRRAR